MDNLTNIDLNQVNTQVNFVLDWIKIMIERIGLFGFLILFIVIIAASAIIGYFIITFMKLKIQLIIENKKINSPKTEKETKAQDKKNTNQYKILTEQEDVLLRSHQLISLEVTTVKGYSYNYNLQHFAEAQYDQITKVQSDIAYYNIKHNVDNYAMQLFIDVMIDYYKALDECIKKNIFILIENIKVQNNLNKPISLDNMFLTKFRSEINDISLQMRLKYNPKFKENFHESKIHNYIIERITLQNNFQKEKIFEEQLYKHDYYKILALLDVYTFTLLAIKQRFENIIKIYYSENFCVLNQNTNDIKLEQVDKVNRKVKKVSTGDEQ